ncbi:hypothetical protein BDY19DRAFT_673830 [Irpex rosettiformis]|uniref:Uncharacterized protein n=1 Tax=Irpex rosettiformis TaxID=378272 RepID=A0ACB8UA16_9APHY|nr:hypothetical protein BDY19DRAFT_673830 [Irpex rosettiformis]
METPGTGIPHRCLHVAEVQAIIFGLLAREDCVCLARTCGLFYNEAMNAVWAEVKSLVPFVRCMPLDAVAESNSANPIWSGSDTTITFCKEPTSSDWQSFSKHAHRVRKFLDTDILFTHIYSYQPNGEVEHTIPVSVFQLATSAWQTITHFICQHHSTDSAPLFPNLVALQARSITDVFFRSYLPYICGVTLQTFILEFGVPINPGLGGGFYSTFSELLPAMRTSWPHLSSVEINAPECSIQGQATKHVEEISVWIKNLAQLHFLHVHTGCHPSLIQNLSELPFLHTLDLKGEPGTTSDPTLNFAPSSLSSRFQSLKELKLITYLPDSPVPLLRALNGSNTLTKITLAFGCMRGLPSFTETPQAIEAIYHLPAVNFLDLSFAHYKATTGLISTIRILRHPDHGSGSPECRQCMDRTRIH